MRLVFVCSDGSAALPLLQSRGSWSHAKKPVCKVGEISDDDAMLYLVDRGVDKAMAAEAVHTITGGMFSLLDDFVDMIGANKSLPEIRRAWECKLNVHLHQHHIAVDHELFKVLTRDGRVEADEAEEIMNADLIESLVKANILAVHPDYAYTFHDRLMATYFHTRLSMQSNQQSVLLTA